ncbi:MAG: hypothetical protein WC969_10435 [Elusimicrobiota bacterium]
MTQRHPTMIRREGRDRFVWVLPQRIESPYAVEPVSQRPLPTAR